MNLSFKLLFFFFLFSKVEKSDFSQTQLWQNFISATHHFN